MEGPGVTLGSPWPPLTIRPCLAAPDLSQHLLDFYSTCLNFHVTCFNFYCTCLKFCSLCLTFNQHLPDYSWHLLRFRRHLPNRIMAPTWLFVSPSRRFTAPASRLAIPFQIPVAPAWLLNKESLQHLPVFSPISAEPVSILAARLLIYSAPA
jgi:hypothetical protein